MVDEFEVGNKVLLRVPMASSAIDSSISKFFLLYKGWYSVVQRVGKSAYSLADENGTVVGTYNIRALKKYFD